MKWSGTWGWIRESGMRRWGRMGESGDDGVGGSAYQTSVCLTDELQGRQATYKKLPKCSGFEKS